MIEERPLHRYIREAYKDSFGGPPCNTRVAGWASLPIEYRVSVRLDKVVMRNIGEKNPTTAVYDWLKNEGIFKIGDIKRELKGMGLITLDHLNILMWTILSVLYAELMRINP
jgi:hypothetical protein